MRLPLLCLCDANVLLNICGLHFRNPQKRWVIAHPLGDAALVLLGAQCAHADKCKGKCDNSLHSIW